MNFLFGFIRLKARSFDICVRHFSLFSKSHSARIPRHNAQKLRISQVKTRLANDDGFRRVSHTQSLNWLMSLEKSGSSRQQSLAMLQMTLEVFDVACVDLQKMTGKVSKDIDKLTSDWSTFKEATQTSDINKKIDVLISKTEVEQKHLVDNLKSSSDATKRLEMLVKGCIGEVTSLDKKVDGLSIKLDGQISHWDKSFQNYSNYRTDILKQASNTFLGLICILFSAGAVVINVFQFCMLGDTTLDFNTLLPF